MFFFLHFVKRMPTMAIVLVCTYDVRSASLGLMLFTLCFLKVANEHC